jgi:carbamate kinase
MTITELPDETTLHLPRRSERYTEVKRGGHIISKILKEKNRLIFEHGTNPNVGIMLASQMCTR